MEDCSLNPSAFKTTQLLDNVIEMLMLYLTKDKEPLHVAALGTVIADLKQVRRHVRLFEGKETLERMAGLEICNHLFSRVLNRLRQTNKHFPFSIYRSHFNHGALIL